MRVSEFKERCKEFFKRDYRHEGNEWHAKQLVYCRHKVLNQSYEEVSNKPSVLIGQLVHLAVDRVLMNSGRVYTKEVGKYKIIGTPDVVMDYPVEVKFTSYAPKTKPREHDVMQLKIYMWLLDCDVGYIWYLSPGAWVDFEVRGKMSDEDIVRLIEEPKYPMWSWECNHCSLYPCKYKFEEVLK